MDCLNFAYAGLRFQARTNSSELRGVRVSNPCLIRRSEELVREVKKSAVVCRGRHSNPILMKYVFASWQSPKYICFPSYSTVTLSNNWACVSIQVYQLITQVLYLVCILRSLVKRDQHRGMKHVCCKPQVGTELRSIGRIKTPRSGELQVSQLC